MTRRGRWAIVIEDNAGDAELLTGELSLADPTIDVVSAADGDEALSAVDGARARPSGPSIVLLDWHVPLRAGAEILAAMRRCEATAHVPIIVLSSSTAEFDEAHAYRGGASCYLVKPMRIDRYRDVISRAIRYFLGLEHPRCPGEGGGTP